VISSRNFSSKITIWFLLWAGLLCLYSCAGAKEVSRDETLPAEPRVAIAVFPIENLSGVAAPLKPIRGLIVDQLKKKGFNVLDDEALEAFMVRNRVRYTGGIDALTAQAIKKETGVEGIVIASLELYSDAVPPKAALTARLISAGENPSVAWMDGVGLAGDDSPGILALGLIEDPEKLVTKAVDTLTWSLADQVYRNRERAETGKLQTKFKPRIVYRAAGLDPGKKPRVAVLPFFNKSGRKYGGEIMVLNVMRALKHAGFDVVESGIVRSAFLSLRIIMEDGISLAEAKALFTASNADFVLGGWVLDYQDYDGASGNAKVGFSVQLINKESQKIAWSSLSQNNGDDKVYFFDWGRVNTAHAMASQMARFVGDMIAKR
jgi:TolB-like protein